MSLKHWIVLMLLVLGVGLAGCGGREIEIKPKGQMVIGGSVGGSTTRAN